MMPFFKPEVDVMEDVVDIEVCSLVVFNDEVNTFEFVIDTLIDVCQHTPEQAEQCTILIHHKGKCSVKNGNFEELVPLRNEICRRGIAAEITH